MVESKNFMKRWAWIVAGLYGVILFALTVPASLLAFAPKLGLSEALGIYATWLYWAWLPIMLLSQFALLSVPVRVASRRPVTRGALWPTILAGGLMAGALVCSGAWSILEFIFGEHGSGNRWWGGVAAAVLTWCLWSMLFFRLSRNLEPADFISRQCRLLLKGSILELLIAVPTHIVARYRNYCCAGFMTFIGLTMGVAVMLFSFGPAVFFLYADRWKRLHPNSDGGQPRDQLVTDAKEPL
jgi:hypothetical protein